MTRQFTEVPELKISMQRDELRMELCDLYDIIVHGVNNGLLPEKSPRENLKDPKAKCKNGHTRRDVQWRLGSCCLDCDGLGDCHVSFEEKDLFEEMHRALELVRKPSAEMPEITPDGFERYTPGGKYSLTPRRMARDLYRFCVGYWCYSDHSDIQLEKEWERVYNDTLCIDLDSIGRDGRSFRRFLEIAEKDDLDDDDKDFVKSHPEIEKTVEDAVKSRDIPVKGAKDIDTLILHAILIRMDYKFAHEYPGADMGVYGGVFESIIDGCLAVAGLSPDDRPKSYDFDDKQEYRRRFLEYEARRNIELFKFMEEQP